MRLMFLLFLLKFCFGYINNSNVIRFFCEVSNIFKHYLGDATQGNIVGLSVGMGGNFFLLLSKNLKIEL